MTLREGWAGRRWRWRLAAWTLFVLLAVALPYRPEEGPGYLLGLIALSAVLAVVDARPFMTPATGLLLASITRVLILDDRFSPYADGVADPWVAVELLVLPLATLPPIMLTWAILTRFGKEPGAWMVLPGDAAPQALDRAPRSP